MERVESEKKWKTCAKIHKKLPSIRKQLGTACESCGSVSGIVGEKSKEMTAFIKTLKTVQPRKQLSFQKTLAGAEDGSIFGFILCGIHTPKTLKKLFEKLPPIFKNVEVSREYIGDHLRTYAENNILIKPRRMLTGSYFGKATLTRLYRKQSTNPILLS